MADLERARDTAQRIVDNVKKVIIGKDEPVELAVVALMCQGHMLVEDVPGVGKTMLARSLAKSIGCSFGRIQFTPDLLPSDITGVSIYNQKTQEFEFKNGPIMSQFVLADEINRATPKTQSALLEAMEERQVTVEGVTHQLPRPFTVMATQNPIEYEGTFPLPEAQLDRFIFELWIDYPDPAEEEEIVRTTTSAYKGQANTLLSSEEIIQLQQLVRQVPVADHVIQYAVRLVRSSRPTDPLAPDYVKSMVNWGAGPRASQYLILGGKARAILDGRHSVAIEDVQALALPVLRHRIVINFHAEAENITPSSLVQRLLEDVPTKGEAG